MNKEDYVSLEVAKLLKKKGYDEECGLAIGVNSLEGKRFITHRTNSKLPRDICSKPTLYEAQKWLRTKKGLHIEIIYMNGDYWLYEILTIPNHDLIGLSDRENVKHKNYEEALNAGILEALKLIE